jgi:flagellar biosynthesis component FlhA
MASLHFLKKRRKKKGENIIYLLKVSKIFNVITPLAISVFFDRKLLTCAAHAFFGTKIPQLPHIYVLILKTTLFKNKKKIEKQKKKKKEKKKRLADPFGGGRSTPI